MDNKPTDAQKLRALSNALADSLLDATDEEILEEARLSGIDPAAEAIRVKTLLLTAVKTHQQRALRAARKAYNAEAQKPMRAHSVPSSPEARRDLLSFIMAKQPQYAELLTAQHRDFKNLTDEDVESYLEDLAELGLLDKLNPDASDDDK